MPSRARLFPRSRVPSRRSERLSVLFAWSRAICGALPQSAPSCPAHGGPTGSSQRAALLRGVILRARQALGQRLVSPLQRCRLAPEVVQLSSDEDAVNKRHMPRAVGIVPIGSSRPGVELVSSCDARLGLLSVACPSARLKVGRPPACIVLVADPQSASGNIVSTSCV